MPHPEQRRGFGVHLDDPPYCNPRARQRHRRHRLRLVDGLRGRKETSAAASTGSRRLSGRGRRAVRFGAEAQLHRGSQRRRAVPRRHVAQLHRARQRPGSVSTLSTFGGSSASFCNVKGAIPGADNFDLPEFFVNATARDYRLTQFSPSIDIGDPSAAGISTTDLEGEPRAFGVRVDVGADEHTGAVSESAARRGRRRRRERRERAVRRAGDQRHVWLFRPHRRRRARRAAHVRTRGASRCRRAVSATSSAACSASPTRTTSSRVRSARSCSCGAHADPLAPGFFTLASDVAFPASPALVPTGPAPLTVAVPGGLPFR